MAVHFKPDDKYEKFGLKLYFLLVENFSQTYFVGGMVRDLFLHRKIKDIDIATVGQPENVVALLTKHRLKHDDKHRGFGIVIVPYQDRQIEIATLRKELSWRGRYPKVVLTKSVRTDSARRDFTINALYLSQKSGTIIDCHKGQRDIKKRIIRLIGESDLRIKQDPLRIIRGLRLHYELKFSFAPKTLSSIKRNLHLLKELTLTRKARELNKIKNKNIRTKIIKFINNPAYLT